MSSSIEEYFEPPEWATKDEVIKTAKHYVNYWRIEAKSANARANDAEGRIAGLKAENERLNTLLSIAERNVKNLLRTPEWTQIAELTADYRDLEAENRRLRASSFVTAVPSEDYEKLKAENERLRKAGDAMAFVVAEIPMQRNDSMLVALKVMEWNAAKQPPTDPV